ncbi:MAG: diguanylate cyclase [Myxococcota bacterium]
MNRTARSYAAARQAVGRLVELLTFAHMPVRQKFALFSLGVSFWFLALGIPALVHASHVWEVVLLAGGLLVAHTLLGLFAWMATRSITRPIDSMVEQVRTLTAGHLDALERVVVESGDEIGELTARFNCLLAGLRDVNTFKKVIETDESLGDVYVRLSEVFTGMGLPEHRLYTVDTSHGGLETVIASGEEGDWCRPDVRGDETLCRACRTGQAVSSGAYKGICRHFALGGEREHLCLPVLIGGQTRAVVQFTGDASLGGKAKQDAVQRYIKEAVPVLKAKQLESQLRASAMRDALTGLYNRRYLEETHPRITARALRREEGLGVIMCDIDHFKDVNDTFGHAAGDTMLARLGEVLSESVRTEDLVVRYGGEEFLVVLVDADADTTARAAERIRVAVERLEFHAAGTPIHKTVSLGMSVFPRDGDAFWECVQRADEALYHAKESGRNRVVSASAADLRAAEPAPGGPTDRLRPARVVDSELAAG